MIFGEKMERKIKHSFLNLSFLHALLNMGIYKYICKFCLSFQMISIQNYISSVYFREQTADDIQTISRNPVGSWVASQSSLTLPDRAGSCSPSSGISPVFQPRPSPGKQFSGMYF